ncbi:ABC transporter H family member 2-like [Drosophila santomea]|uniref:ABC transporter H family member 2-like n=1 Tax=Drosophila santomea TaxID=129105 RepID=UPI001952D311|nr:ABC transporter H family member 2-like [Drosophila santomea]XP_043862526.1 ABC transporter H family member 2-like [Drosophila santomea]
MVRSPESGDKVKKETQKQEQEKEEPQVLEAHRETGIWSQYQWGGNNPPPFPMPFAMPSMNGWTGFGIPYPMMGNPFRSENFNQGDTSNYQGPYRSYQNRNSRWNQNQANRDRQWNGYNSNKYNNNYNNRNNNNGYNSNNYNNSNNGYNSTGYGNNDGRGQLAIEPQSNTEGSGQSRMSRNSNNSGQSRQSYNSNNSKRSFNSTGTASVSAQLHNIQEDDGNFPQSASNNPQDI